MLQLKGKPEIRIEGGALGLGTKIVIKGDDWELDSLAITRVVLRLDAAEATRMDVEIIPEAFKIMCQSDVFVTSFVLEDLKKVIKETIKSLGSKYAPSYVWLEEKLTGILEMMGG